MKTKVYSVSLPENMANDLDEYCKTYNYNRSEFLRELIRNKLYGKKDVSPRRGRGDVSAESHKIIESDDMKHESD